MVNPMNFYGFFYEIFRALFFKKYHVVTKEELKQRDKLLSKKICSSFARGSISLINGKYMTSEDLEKRRTATINYFLSNNTIQ